MRIENAEYIRADSMMRDTVYKLKIFPTTIPLSSSDTGLGGVGLLMGNSF